MKDFLDPAIKGTTGILKAVKAYAPTVKRVVVTSSFAAIINPFNHAKVYDETIWNPLTWEQAKEDHSQTYRGSKVRTIFERLTLWDSILTFRIALRGEGSLGIRGEGEARV